jgi:cytochrome c biogenesis protein CcmG, thiol:disulfide interchange protein DsbE
LNRTLARNIAIGVGVVAVAVAVIVGIGDTPESESVGAGNPQSAADEADFQRALADAPPKLASLYAGGDRLLPGGADELHKQLAAVRGYPAVVNVWASWCGPCRFEFPFFQLAAIEHGDRVAFIGVDSFDDDASAHTFLDELPLPYPSVTDPDRDVWPELSLRGLPATAFYDADGERVHVRPGPYRTADELEADIQRYAN